MHPYPHTYRASASGSAADAVTVKSDRLPDISTAPPAEFDGPGDAWSPETLLVGAVADCFVLTFRGVSRAAKFSWTSIDCSVDGTLERIDGVTRFSGFTTRAKLIVGSGADASKARELLERSEKSCLIANSLTGERRLEIAIIEAN